MPFLPDSEPTTGRFVPDQSSDSPLDTVKKGLSNAKDYGLAIAAGAGEGVAATEAGVGTFIQAPAANTLSGLAGARALADRGITAAINYVAPGSAEVNPEYQETAQQASAFAAEQRAENAKVNAIARFGAGMAEDGRMRVREIQQFNQEYNPELVRQQQAMGQTEGFVDTLKGIKDNPMAFTHTLARSAPDMAVGAGVAQAAAKGVAAAGGSVAKQIGAASTTGILAESASSANQAREMVYQQVAEMPLDRLAASPRYREILAQTKDAIAAREALANELADQAPVLAGAGTALGSVVTNKLFGGDTSAKMIAGAERTTGKAVAKNVAQETTEEGLQGVPEDLAQHGAMVQADPSKKFDLGKTLAENMAAGFAMGAGGSSMAYARDNWKRGSDGAAPGATPDNATPADQVLGGDHSPSANSEQATAAEKALFAPASLTALDRVAEIDAKLPTATAEEAPALQAERESITKTWPKTVSGAPASFSTETGARLEGQYALIEAGDLITSHDENLRQSPLYPQELQPRERDRAASEMQVSGIVQKLDPARLGLSADAATGAPIVGADGLVESGNARTIALKRVYQANGQKAEDYKQFLKANAAQFGIAAESIDAMQKPVLVRVRSTPVNRAEFARQANASTVAQMSPSEQAKSDANRLDVLDDLRPDENGDFTASRDFIRRFMAKLPATEQAGMIDASGNLSQTGYTRIRNAVLAKAYGDSPVLTRMVESMNDDLRNVGKALMQAAPEVAKLRQDVAEGALFDADITPDLLAAVTELSALRDAGRSVQDALAQAGMFGEKYSPETRELLQFLSDNIRRPRVMAEFILRYTEALRAAGNPNQGSIFGEATAPTKGQLMTAAKGNEDAAEDTQRADAGKDEGTGGQGASQPADAQRGEGRTQSDEGPRSEWVRFPAETGTLGIPRSEMPQIKGDHRGALIQFLDGRGIPHETVGSMSAAELKPTQAEFSTKKTETWADVREGVDRSVLISSDGYILDGHHQWVAALATGGDVKAIRFGAPIRDLLAAVHQFPSVKRSEGHTSDPKRAQAREDFEAAMADLGAVLRDFAGVMRMVPENTPDFMPALVKAFESGIKLVGYNIRDLIAHVKKAAKADATLKKIWNKIPEATYMKAAKLAVDNMLANPEGAGQGDLFSQPKAPAAGQGDLFSAMAAAAPEMFKPKRLSWEERKKDNYVAPDIKDVVPADVHQRTAALVKKWKDNLPEAQISKEDRDKAEALLQPVIDAAERDEPWFDERVRAIGKMFLGSQLGPTKKIGRAAVKLVEEKFNLAEMKDIVRATVVVNSYDDAQAALDAIEQKFEILQINNKTDLQISAPEGAKLKNKGVSPEGYSDVTAFVRLPGGGIAEIQINEPEMLSAKADAHILYEGSRVVEDDPARQGEYAELRDGQRDIYQAAAASALRRLASATERMKYASSELQPLETGERGSGTSATLSSSKRNQFPSGNLTNSSPPNEDMKSQPSGNFSGTGNISTTSNDSIAESGAPKNDKDRFTLTRLDRKTMRMAPVTFERGEYVRYLLSGRNEAFGEIDGISHAKREFSVDGLWYPFGAAYKAERPAEEKRPDTVQLSSVIDKANIKHGEGLTEADRVPEAPAGIADQHAATIDKMRDGTLSLEEYRAGFTAVIENRDAITDELSKLTKDGLFKRFPGLAYRYKNDKKADVVDAAYRSMLDDFVLGNSIQWSMGEKYENVIRRYVDKATEESLREFSEKVKQSKEDRQKAREEAKKAIADPKTLEDFGRYLRAKISEGMTEQEARLSLSPEQRAKYDDLFATETRSSRTGRRESANAEVRVAAQTTTGQVIETKHTKTGEPLFVVKAADRVDRDIYNQWNAAAKKLGGWYSSFRGNGAVPGFQFKTRENADAFLQFLGGDVQPAQEMVKERRDAFADDRSQSAVERLNEMAERLEEKADESLGRERKANTNRRARFAASAEAAANAEKALAKTMRNIAKAIDGGNAKFLDRVRQKAQVEMLRSVLNTAQGEKIRAKYPTYLEQERHKGEAPNGETADYARWPSFTAFRSDLASLGRELSQIDGAKQIGKRLLSVADDVTDAYQKFAKENLHKVSIFSKAREGSETKQMAMFSTADAAESAIARSGYKGKATTISFKRGQHLVIMGPEMAKEAGLWNGDTDKRITLRSEFGEEIVAKVREMKGRKIGMPWTFDSASTERARWKGLGIETAAEMRAALREFVSLREAPAEADRIKQMERAMIGRKNDGLDFFPTPAETAKALIDAAEIEEGMSVLEPSAGMGHIAEQIREAGVDPDVIEYSNDRRELLEAKGFRVVGNDFMEMSPRGFTFGDVFRDKDGTEGVMRGLGGLGSNRVRLVIDGDERTAKYVDRDDLTGVRKSGYNSGYDRIIMNPPFSDRRDAEHVQHAYSLLKPGGRIVAIMGEGVFFGQDKRAQDFRAWLEEVGGTSEKLAEGTFMDPSLPVNTATNARMVVIDKPEASPKLSRGTGSGMAIRDLKAVVSRVSAGFKNLPPVHVFESPAQAPKALREFIADAGATETVEGAMHDGEIYLFASGLSDEARAEHVLATHEITHYGLRGAVGKGLDAALQHVWLNNAKVRREANTLREKFGIGSNVEAVEEVLADMPTGELAKLNGWRRVVKAVRDWLRKAGAEKLADRLDAWMMAGLSDQERADLFVADLLMAARNWVKNGKKPASGVFGMSGTRLADGTLAEDIAKQEKWLTKEAKARGYQDIEDLLARNYPLFEKLAELWRKKNPAEVLLSRSAMKSVSANIDRGLKALADAITGKTTVHRAMFRAGLGWVDFVWGSTGTVMQSGRTKGAKGLAHIVEARMRKDGLSEKEAIGVLNELVRTIASGEEFDRKIVSDVIRVGLRNDGYVAWLAKQPGNNGWVVTGYEENPDGKAAGRATANPTLAVASLTRDDDGAGSGGNMPRLSRGINQPTAAERADAIIAKPAGTRKPIDTIARALTQAFRVDSLTRKVYAKAGALLDRYTPENIKAGVVADYGIPEAVIDRRIMMQGAMKQQLRGAGMLIEKLATLTREESRLAYEWMNNADPQAAAYFEAQLPPESVKIMADVKRMIDDLSKEAVRLGQLSPEAFERNRFEYLHRSYQKHTAELTKAETASRQRAIAVLGDQYKGRGMTDAIDMSRVKNVAPEWWGRKLQAGKADAGLKGEKFIRLERRAPVGEGTRPLEEAQGPGDANPLRKGKLLEVAYWPAGEKIPAKYSTWEQAGTWEVRDTKGGKLVVWRDFTKQERVAMGEIDEARFAIAKTLHGMIHDIETGRYLEWLAQNHAKKEGETIDGEIVEASESMRTTFAPGTWVKVPESKVQGTSVLKYGTLAGRYLPGPVWNDVRQTVGFRFKPLGETYAAILSAWKTAKTALSPAVHTNNVMANMVMADWHDITAGHMVKALRILLGASERKGEAVLGRAGNVAARAGIADREAAQEILNRFQESGGNLGSWVTSELQKEQLEPLLKALENEIGIAGETPGAQVGTWVALQKLLQLRLPSAWDAFKPTKTGKYLTAEAGNMLALYEAEDQVFRLAAWLKAKEEGAGDLAAGKVARRSFLDYHINAPWIHAARNTVLPFVAFTYRAVPMMLDIMAHKPWKLMKLAAIAGALNALGYLLSGGDEDDERRLLPEEKAGRIWGIVPKLIRMPWNDINSQPVFLDVRRWVPVGDIFDTGATNTAVPVLPAMVPGGPLAVLAELVINKTQFTGKAITLDTDTASEKAAKVADHLYKAFAPNIVVLPGTYAWTGVTNASTGRTDSFGREQSTPQAVASAFGVKLGSYPIDQLQLNAQRKAQSETMEIDRNITQLKRELIRKGITQEEFNEKAAVQQAKKQKILNDLSKKMGGE